MNQLYLIIKVPKEQEKRDYIRDYDHYYTELTTLVAEALDAGFRAFTFPENVEITKATIILK